MYKYYAGYINPSRLQNKFPPNYNTIDNNIKNKMA